MKTIALLVMSLIGLPSFAADRNQPVCPDQPKTICEVAQKCVDIRQRCYVLPHSTPEASGEQYVAQFVYTVRSKINCLTPNGELGRLDKVSPVEYDRSYLWPAGQGTEKEVLALCERKLDDLVAAIGACR